jgi:hypothetical protein
LFNKTSNKGYEAKAYNIYIIPREAYGFSPKIKLDASAMDFNAKHGMDWNTWIRDGTFAYK